MEVHLLAEDPTTEMNREMGTGIKAEEEPTCLGGWVAP
jgi:hypothetical protein